jgi:hypothetical protein
MAAPITHVKTKEYGWRKNARPDLQKVKQHHKKMNTALRKHGFHTVTANGTGVNLEFFSRHCCRFLEPYFLPSRLTGAADHGFHRKVLPELLQDMDPQIWIHL